MTLTLTVELESFVRDEARKGAYASSSEYVRSVLRERFLKQREREAALQTLDEALARGLADAEAGRVLPIDEAFRVLRERLGLPQDRGEP
jgi:antitoxin ParD1/3/4